MEHALPRWLLELRQKFNCHRSLYTVTLYHEIKHMNLTTNRKRRKKWLWRRFIPDSRVLAKRRSEILTVLIATAKRNNIQPIRGIRKRCKTISKFVMHEERSQWIKDSFDIGLALTFVIVQLFMIPIGIYVRKNEMISSGWAYTGGYLLMVLVLPVLMTVPRYLLCRLNGESFEPYSKPISHLLANISLVLLVAGWYYQFQFPYWIIAGMLTNAFFNVQVWIVDPLLNLLLNRIQKRAIKFHPLEKATHLIAILSDKFYLANNKGRLGNMKWRKKQITYLDMLILIFERYAHMPFQIESGSTKSIFIRRCHQIADHWRVQQMKIYFPTQNTVEELSLSFDQSFVAIIN